MAILEGSGAFLRCDRGSSLYATNLPMKGADWEGRAQEIQRAGFDVKRAGALLLIAPQQAWIEHFSDWAQSAGTHSELTRVLSRFKDRPICEEERAAWLAGVKQLDLPRSAADYEKTVRQTAALAQRKGCGGLLQACGLCLDRLKEEESC